MRGPLRALGAITCAATLVSIAGDARAEDEHELVPLPVARFDVGFLSNPSEEDAGILGEIDVGAHFHYRYAFFGGEIGYAASQASEPALAQFFQLGLPIGVTTEEAFFGIGFTPRLLLGERLNHDITALRLAGTIYALGGSIVVELGHERWFGDGGGAHITGFIGVDAGRFLYLIIDDSELSKLD
ncbi:MAG TPA: hypothetical protein VL400_14840 [Polyangiaceae bacterium]|jgi:hypothetical protein|nr:hypothetical protein [Polyangiaceae bacterium]